MKNHVTAVGAIHLGFGIIGLVVAIVVFLVFNFLKIAVEGNEIPYILFKFLSLSLPALICLFSTLGLVGGIGLLLFRSWARYLVIVTAVLGCFIIPVGTLIGVYLWVLFQDDTIKLFENKTQRGDK